MMSQMVVAVMFYVIAEIGLHQMYMGISKK